MHHKHREDPTDSVDIREEQLVNLDLTSVRPHDWVYGLGTLSIEAAGVLNQLGRHGFTLTPIPKMSDEILADIQKAVDDIPELYKRS